MSASSKSPGKGIITTRELGARIRAIREWRGYSNRVRFCSQAGINPGSLSTYERGASTPNFTLLIQLSDLLEITVDQLLALDTIPGFDTKHDEDDPVTKRRSTLNDCYVSNPENARILDTVVCCLNDKHDTEKAMDALAAVMDVARPCLSHDCERAG